MLFSWELLLCNIMKYESFITCCCVRASGYNLTFTLDGLSDRGPNKKANSPKIFCQSKHGLLKKCNKTAKCLAYLHNCVLEILRNFSGMMHLFGVPSYTGRRSQSAIVIPTVDTNCSSALHLSVKSKQTWRHGSMGLSPPGTHFGRNKEQRIKLLYGEHVNSGIS